MAPERLTLKRDGAALFAGAALSVLKELDAIAARLPSDRPGVRLQGAGGLAGILAANGPVGALPAEVLGAGCRPVRTILFDKSPAANWALGWHQDRTIVVREQRNVPGFAAWTMKQGMIHVEPPFGVIEAMITLRLHFDDVPPDNAPLLIAPGSHRLGRIEEERIAATVATCGTAACLANRGDVWLYSTPILHASAASRANRHRRVLQIDYARGTLPGGLEWLGI